MPLVYRLGNIFCLPSKGPNETWGLAVNEAMACGRPVLVSNKVGCAIDFVEQDKNGWVFPSNNKTTLFQVFNTILDNPGQLKKMERKGLEKITEWNYTKTVEVIASEITYQRNNAPTK